MKIALRNCLLACSSFVACSGLADEKPPVNEQPNAGSYETTAQRLLSEDKLSNEIATLLLEGIAAVKSNDQEVSLLDVVKRLRPFGYGVVNEAADASAGGGSIRGRDGRGGRGGSRGGQTGEGSQGGQGGQGASMDDEQMKAKFDSFDRNRDGVWKKDEINSYMSSHPASGDGEVTFDEYKQAWAELRSGRQDGGRGGRGGGQRGGGGQGRGHGGGHGRPSVSERASEDAKFIVALDLNRDRKLTESEVRQSVAKQINEQQHPAPEADNAQAPSPQPIEMTARGKLRLQDRLLSRARAIRAILILSNSSNDSETLDATVLSTHVADEANRKQLWSQIASEDKAIPKNSLYQSLRRVPSDQIGWIR